MNSLSGICAEWGADIGEILFTEQHIQGKIKELAREISEYYRSRVSRKKPLVCVGLLTGSFIFVSDLLRHLSIPYIIDFMVVSSYGSSTTSTGSIKLKKDMSIDPAGRDILILEDLIDTGHTLKWIQSHLSNKRINSLRLCCLLNKQERREVEVQIDYCGFVCPDKFVVGYGMDFNEQFRCLPCIGVLKPEAYSS